MSVIVREGSLEEVVSVVEQINEFAQKESVASLSQRLSGKKSLILVAEEAGVLLVLRSAMNWNRTLFTVGLVVYRRLPETKESHRLN